MKNILFFILLLNTAKAQTYTTSQLSARLREQWKTNDSLRKQVATFQAKFDIKDIRDDERNVKIKRLELKLDSAAAYFNSNDFYFDTVTKTYSIKPDTFIVIRKVQQGFGITGVAADTRLLFDAVNETTNSGASLTFPTTGIVTRVPLDGPYSNVPLQHLAMPYTTGSNNQGQKGQDTEYIKWQRDSFEKLLNDDKKIIDKLQKIIDKQQAQISKLTKNKN